MNVLTNSAMTSLRFEGRNDPWFTYLDNISVEIATVPEMASSALLMAMGLAAIGSLRCGLRRT